MPQRPNKAERRRLRSKQKEKEHQMAVTSKRQYEKDMREPKEVYLGSGITVAIRQVTEADLVLSKTMPDEAFPNLDPKDPRRFAKLGYSSTLGDECKLAAGIVDPGYNPSYLPRLDWNPDAWDHQSLPTAARQAAIAYIDSGMESMKRVREQYEGMGAVSGDREDQGASQPSGGSDGAVGGSGPQVSGVRQAGHIHGSGEGESAPGRGGIEAPEAGIERPVSIQDYQERGPVLQR